MRYDFEVLKGDRIIAAERLVVKGLPDVWSRIANIAEHVDQPGCRIRVKEEAGGIAILIGLTAVRSMFEHSAPHPSPR